MNGLNWDQYIGDINVGRNHLGDSMPVAVYRLFEFTIKDVLIERYGKDVAVDIFRETGRVAGHHFTKALLDKNQDFYTFMKQLQMIMQDLKMGILRIEFVDEQANQIVLSVSEDLDCSGLPVIGETVCNYDEGFISGVLKEFSGHNYEVIEMDCWAKGGRTCRFEAKRK